MAVRDFLLSARASRCSWISGLGHWNSPLEAVVCVNGCYRLCLCRSAPTRCRVSALANGSLRASRLPSGRGGAVEPRHANSYSHQYWRAYRRLRSQPLHPDRSKEEGTGGGLGDHGVAFVWGIGDLRGGGTTARHGRLGGAASRGVGRNCPRTAERLWRPTARAGRKASSWGGGPSASRQWPSVWGPKTAFWMCWIRRPWPSVMPFPELSPAPSAGQAPSERLSSPFDFGWSSPRDS